MCALHEDIFRRVWDLESAHDMWMALQAFFGDFSTSDDREFNKEDDHKEEAHKCDKHDHNLVIMEDCSTSWSSDDDDDSTIRSLDKIDDDATSDVNDDATPCTLVVDDDDGYESDVSTSSSTTSHCFMSQGDTKVSNANVIDLDSYEELLDRFGSMIKALEKEMAKTKKLKNKTLF
jgi:ribulose kinase